MGSPAKKRKLDGADPKPPARSLEYFFAKQKQPAPATAKSEHVLSDEELARKLQAEWNREDAAQSSANETAGPVKPQHALAEDGLCENGGTANVNQDTLSDKEDGGTSDPVPTPAAAPAAAPARNILSLQSVAAAEDLVPSSLPLDESPLTFQPSQYIDQLKGQWSAEGGDASYALLTRCFVLVSGTTSRIKIVDTLVNCIRILIEADPTSLLPAVWLATNSISPPYISLELGLGGSAISKALKQVCGLDSRSLKAIYDKHGDPGDVAFEAKKKQSFMLRRPKPLTIKGVFQSLVKIAKSQGQGSVRAKQQLINRLLQDARGGEESRFIVRTLCQHVRPHVSYIHVRYPANSPP